MRLTLDLAVTLCVIAASAALFLLASARAGRPADPLKPRLIPWRPVIILAGFVGVVALVHLVNIFGIETGRR